MSRVTDAQLVTPYALKAREEHEARERGKLLGRYDTQALAMIAEIRHLRCELRAAKRQHKGDERYETVLDLDNSAFRR